MKSFQETFKDNIHVLTIFGLMVLSKECEEELYVLVG